MNIGNAEIMNVIVVRDGLAHVETIGSGIDNVMDVIGDEIEIFDDFYKEMFDHEDIVIIRNVFTGDYVVCRMNGDGLYSIGRRDTGRFMAMI